MKALSIKQPWLNLILTGQKTIEVRNRNTTYRGDLLLCSSRSPALTKEGMEEMEEFIGMPYLFGHALCVARLVDARRLQAGDEEAAFQEEIDPEMHGWHLESIRPVDPFEVKGALGFYEVDDALINASPLALWDCVRVRDDVDESELDFSIKGWHGRIVSIRFADEEGWTYTFVPDGLSIRDVPLAHIKECVADGGDWHALLLEAKELDRAEPRDTMDEALEALAEIERQYPELFPEEEEGGQEA